MMEKSVFEKFNVSVVGKENGGETIVFAHGFGSNQYAWDFMKDYFCTGNRLVFFDHVGSGNMKNSVHNPSAYSSIDYHRDNILDIYKALELKNTIFIGHSVSAMLGLSASLLHPEYFKKMILIGGSPRYLNDKNYIGGFERQDLDNLYQFMASNYFEWANGFGNLAMGNGDRPSLGEAFALTLQSMRPDVAQSVAKAIFESDFRASLPSVTIPMLIIQAQKDIAVPLEVGEYLAQNIPGSLLKVIDAEGHFPHLSAPETVAKEIADYIDYKPRG